MYDYIRLESVDELTEDLIQNLVKTHRTQKVPRFNKLERYFLSKHDIEKRQLSDKSKPNNKISTPFPYQIVNFIQGYFLGIPVKYSSKNPALLDALSEVFKLNSESEHNSELARNEGIYGISYELVYMNENNEIKFAPISPESVIMIYDVGIEPNAIASIRYYDIPTYSNKQKGKTIIEVYTDEMIYTYETSTNGLILKNEQQHYFGFVPLNAYYNNDEEFGDFERVIPLIDAYDKAKSDLANESDYFSDAYLMISSDGLDLETEEEQKAFQDMKNNKILLLDNGSSASWLTKQLDTASSEAYLNRLEKNIYRLSFVPDLSDDSFAGNLSGVAIKYKFQGLEQIVANKERFFKKSLMNRIKMIINILNIKGNNFDVNDVQIKFERNIPVDNNSAIDIAKETYGIVSKETTLSLLPFVTDVEAEMKRLDEESIQNGTDYNFADELDTESNIDEG